MNQQTSPASGMIPDSMFATEMRQFESPWEHGTAFKPTFTDSGYASTPTVQMYTNQLLDVNLETDQSEILDVEDNNDAGTIYSSATTMLHEVVEQSIEEICKDMYSRLAKQVTEETWPAVSNAIPALIKTFAIKLGNGTDLDRRIMCFVHKRHR